MLGKQFYFSNYYANLNEEELKYRHFANKAVNSSYYDYLDYQANGAQLNLSSSLTKNYSIVPRLSTNHTPKSLPATASPVINFNAASTATISEDYLSMTYSHLSTSPPVTQQPNALLHSFSSSSPPFESSTSKDNTASFVSPLNNKSNKNNSVIPRAFLNRFISENLIKTPLEQEIYSRLWFTYRKDFAPLAGNPKYTSDCGWGCMLRSGQMLLAQALIQHHFNRNWSLFKSISTKSDLDLYRDIVSLFNDRANADECPFGLHNLLQIADESAVYAADSSSSNSSSAKTSRVGTWFGPTAVCLLMRDALNRSLQENAQHYLLKNLRLYVAQDCTIFKRDVMSLCMATKGGEPGSKENCGFTPCIILVSVRLGGESINLTYYESLKAFLRMEFCIGMVGGKPKHSLYFIGYQGDKVIYLDPHLCQPAVNVYSSKSDAAKKNAPITNVSNHKSASLPRNQKAAFSSKQRNSAHKVVHYGEHSDLSSSSASSLSSINSNDSDLFDNSSFHCASPSKTRFAKLDPSLAVGFYCATLKDFNDLCDVVKKV